MSIVIPWLNAVIFFSLAGLHFYWAAGGKWAADVVLPTKEKNGHTLFQPSVMATLAVAVGLLIFGMAALGAVGLLSGIIDIRYVRWSNLMIGIIFLARAVGDFRYVGLSKRVRNTGFAKNDSKYYSPLCLLLSFNSFMIYSWG